MLRNNQLIGFGSGGAYTANAWSFGGAAAFSTLTCTGNVNSYVGSISLWFRKDGNDGAQQFVAQCGGTIVQIRSDNKVDVVTRDGSLNILTEAVSNSTFTTSGTWHHLATSWDTNHAAGSKIAQIYIDGVADLNSVTDVNAAAQVGNTTAYATHTSFAGSQGGTSPFFTGSLAECYFQVASRIDFSVAANLQKFRSTLGKPVNLGATGALPTGTQPLCYFNSPIANLNTNNGSGGNFTTQGTPTAASSHP